MNEREEHQADMKLPEKMLLELPPGHPGRRPFTALDSALRGVKEAEAAARPWLEQILAGTPMTAEDVGEILQRTAALGAAVHHCLDCAAPLHAALLDTMTAK